MTTNDIEQIYSEEFTRSVKRSADSLRRLADELEVEATRFVKRHSRHESATSTAAQMAHTLMWGLANANTDNIMSAAADYDRCVTYAPTEPDALLGVYALADKLNTTPDLMTGEVSPVGRAFAAELYSILPPRVADTEGLNQ